MDKTARYAEAAAAFKDMVAAGIPEPEARAEYDATIARIASMPDTPPQASAPAAKPNGWPEKIRDFVQGGTASAINGASFGLADEALGLVSPKARDDLRGITNNFKSEHPAAAVGSEIAGSIATGGGLRSLAKNLPAVTGLAGKAVGALRGTANAFSGGGLGSTMAQSGLAGFGAGEGDFTDRLGDAALNSVVGGVVGKVGAQIGRGLAGTGTRIAQGLDGLTPLSSSYRARAALAAMGNETPGGLEGLERAVGVNKAQGAMLMDNGGDGAVRMARAIRSRGGPGATVINNAMNTRQRTYAQKITDTFRNGKVFKTGMQTADDISARQKELSDPLYEAFEQSQPKHIPEVEALFERDLFKTALARVEKYNRNKGIKKSLVSLTDDGGGAIRSPRDFDRIKKALDNTITFGKRSTDAESAIVGDEMDLAKELRKEYIDLIDKHYPNYKAARDAWAGEAALKDALEDGAKASSGNIKAEQIVKDMAHMSASEKEMFALGFVDDIRVKVEEGGIKPAKTEQDGMIKRIEAVFGDDASDILTRLRDEVQAHRNASIVVGGSQTADKGSDMFSELVPEEGISVARALVTPYGRTNFLDKMLKRGVTEQVGIDAREKAARMITSSADKDEVLKQIAKELRAQRSARTVRDRVSGPLGAEVAYGFFRRPPQDNEK